MLELIGKTIYILSLYATWQILHKILFTERRTKDQSLYILRIVILACMHIICSISQITFITQPILMLLTYNILSIFEYKASWKSLIIESIFTYAISVIVSLLIIFLAYVLCSFCIFLLNGSLTPAHIFSIPYYVITLIKGTALAITCVALRKTFGQKDLSKLVAKAPLHIFAIISTLFLVCYVFVRTIILNYSAELSISFFFAIFVLCISLALFITSAMREHEVLTDREKAEAEIQEKAAQLSETKDELYYIKSENHKLNKTLPALEHKYILLEKQVRTMKDPRFFMEAGSDVKRQKQVLQSIHQDLEAENRKDHFEIELDLTTGLASVDTYLEYQSKYMLEQGIMFDCIISEKPHCDKLGLNELDFHQIAANLLSNAVHAVEQQTEGRRAVILTMGPQGGTYQIKVTDSGIPFPPSILQDLGRMGNTTDGNGVGYVTLLRILRDCGGSLSIEAYDPPSISGLTKRVVIRFDGRGRIAVLSPGAPEALRNGRGVADLLGETE